MASLENVSWWYREMFLGNYKEKIKEVKVKGQGKGIKVKSGSWWKDQWEGRKKRQKTERKKKKQTEDVKIY